MAGWPYPFTRLEAMAADIYDAAAHHTYKRPKPYPRPWKATGEKIRRGDAAGRTPDQVKAILREKFGQPEAPV
jgi:hypothetical protein